MIDTHSHIDFLSDPKKAIENSIANGVEYIIVPSSAPENFNSAIKLSNEYDCIYSALGVHPEEISKYENNTQKEIVKLIKENEKTIAVGEIGLDYYWDKTTIEEQKKIFMTQIEIALNLNLPVLVHAREALADTIQILKDFKVKKAILHCFQGNVKQAEECIKEGWLIGVGGVVTFKNSKKLKEVVKEIPLDYLVLETDAPYMTPHPFRGQENSPEYLRFIASEIANIKDLTFNAVDKKTTETAKEFFNIN